MNAITIALTVCVANLATNVRVTATKVNSNNEGLSGITIVMQVRSLADDDEPSNRVVMKIAVEAKVSVMK